MRTVMPRWTRNLAEHLSRGVVLRRRLPAPFGGARIYVSPEAGLRFWRRNVQRCDPSLFQLAAKSVKPGMNVWDIGANIGIFAFAAAAMSGPHGFVLAVEPDIETARLMLMTRRGLNPSRYAPIEVLPIAIGRNDDGHDHVARLRIAARGRMSNALAGYGNSQTGGFREDRLVPVLAVDQLLSSFPAPALVKIDVEGAEYDLLRGASKLLSEVRPVIAVEVQPEGDNPRTVAELARSFRYKIYDAEQPPEARVDLPQAPYNSLLVPE